jgi:hypothetical protein
MIDQESHGSRTGRRGGQGAASARCLATLVHVYPQVEARGEQLEHRAAQRGGLEIFGVAERIVELRANVVARGIEPVAATLDVPWRHLIAERDQLAKRGVADGDRIARVRQDPGPGR